MNRRMLIIRRCSPHKVKCYKCHELEDIHASHWPWYQCQTTAGPHSRHHSILQSGDRSTLKDDYTATHITGIDYQAPSTASSSSPTSNH